MSLRTLITRHLNAAAGTYTPNHFLLTLDADTPFIRDRDNPTPDSRFFHIFIHEYWHYLQNISTVSGFKSFAFTQHLLAPFSKTLLANADGTSAGSNALTVQERQNVRSLLDLHNDLDGDAAPTAALSNDWDVDFRVVGIGHSSSTRSYAAQTAPNPTIVLDVECVWSNGSRTTEKMLLGACAIDESVAFIVEEQVRQSTGAAFEPPPVFPYRVAEKTLEFLLGRDPPPFITAALGTLALQTTHPGPGFVQLANALRAELQAGKDYDRAIDAVQRVHRQSVLPIISVILDCDLPNLEQIHQGRGLMAGALAHVGGTMRRALRRRLDHPLFDLQTVFSAGSRPAFAELQRAFPSCDVLQERLARPGVSPRDVIYSFDESGPDAAGNVPSDYTRSLQAQQDFVFAHIARDGSIATSSQCQSKCPYFDACHLPLRAAKSSVCASTPWVAYRQPSGSCWYASAVAAMLGPVQIRKL